MQENQKQNRAMEADTISKNGTSRRNRSKQFSVLLCLIFFVSVSACSPSLHRRATRGNAEAQFELGLAYQAGRGVRQSDREAVRWFRQSAVQGHMNAQEWLGAMYLSGNGVSQNLSEAARWFRLSAAQGNASAQQHLALTENLMAQRQSQAQRSSASNLIGPAIGVAVVGAGVAALARAFSGSSASSGSSGAGTASSAGRCVQCEIASEGLLRRGDSNSGRYIRLRDGNLYTYTYPTPSLWYTCRESGRSGRRSFNTRTEMVNFIITNCQRHRCP